MSRAAWVIVALVAWTSLALFGGWTACVRRPELRTVSPDGERVAFVRSSFAIDPPAQSLWIGDAEGGEAVRVARLAEDQEWCDEIFWSPDGQRVGFLITGLRVQVYDAESSRLIDEQILVEADGYPGSLEARLVSFTPDGKGLRFRECHRTLETCSEERRLPLASPA